MASFTAGTTFVDGVANDVTAAKLGALVTNATPTSGFIQDRTAETITATNDTLLFGDASDSNTLKRITVANFAQTLPTAKVTTGTIDTGTFGTTTSTAATITTGTITNLNSTAGTVATLNSTTGTIANLSATTSTFLGTITGSTNVVNIGSGQIYKDASGLVGIGTTTPYSKLNVFSSITNGDTGEATGLGSIRITNGASALSSDGGLEFKIAGDTNGYGAKIQALNSSGVQLAFANRSATGTWSERMRIDSSGNVGIGTTSPAVPLHVKGSSVFGTINVQSLSTNAEASISFYDSTDTNTDKWVIGKNVGGVSADQFCFYKNGNLAVIDSSGNLSIGTTTALSKLHVHGDLTLSNATTAVTASTSTITPPATVAGYLTVSINGTSRKIPYYAT